MPSSQRHLFETDPPEWEVDDAGEALVATVVFSGMPPGPFDYRVPESLRGEVEPGRRLRVPFGRGNRKVVGYCVAAEHRTGLSHKLKDVAEVVDPRPLVSASMLRLAQWMADHYLCRLGEALDAVVPAGVRSRAGTREVTFLRVPTEVAARLTQLKLPSKQAAALKHLAASAIPLTSAQVAKAVGCTQAPITALRKKGLVLCESQRIDVGSDEPKAEHREANHTLNDDQQKSLAVVLEAMQEGRHETILLRGVTGSGKTEVYIQAIDEVLRFGRQAIVLVPEISLTPQTKQRFRARFDHVAVLHSHLTDSERHRHWRRIAAGEIEVVVGARSAVFAPLPRLGLIVIDEEHDHSFKQDSSPRYHARDVAIRRTEDAGVPLVLGSATPSLESWYEAQQGRYRLVELPQRVLERPLPDVAAIDLRSEFHNRFTRGAVSREMHQAIQQSLDENEQIILLLNRRGFSTHIQCPSCGHVVKCSDCDVALTHHREGEKAACHYCDYETEAPLACPECKNEGIRYSGFGTQKLEAEIRARFQNVSLLRMDSDTMQAPGSHDAALARFRRGDVQILLGTQMIAKGLDFPNVTLVGVINADTALHLPNFRAAESTFQLVTQVAGRTGRGEKGGRVLVQTFTPDHQAIVAALRHDFLGFAKWELPNREQFGYPPYSRLVRMVIRGLQQGATEQFADQLVEMIREGIAAASLEARVLGPAPAPIAKLKGRYRYHALIMVPTLDGLHAIFGQAQAELKSPDDVQWIVDVDALSMM